MNKIIICSGGTGGHLFPAKSVAVNLLKNSNNIITIITDKRSLKFMQDWPNSLNIKTVPTLPVSGKSLFLKLKALLFMGLGCFNCIYYFVKNRPQILVTFGGYTSIPPLVAACILRIPIIIHEQNALAGRANRLFAKFATKIAVSFKKTYGLQKYVNKLEYTGLPVREEFLNLRNKIKTDDLNKQYVITILGGSQGARIFGDFIPKTFAILPINIQKKLKVYQQCREEQIANTITEWQKTNVNYTVKPFFNNVENLIFKSSLIIARSGASTVAEINCIGRTALYVPYKFATDNHQEYNAKAMVESNCAFMLKEDDLNFNTLNKIILKLFETNNKFSIKEKYSKLEYNEQAVDNLSKLIINNLRHVDGI